MTGHFLWTKPEGFKYLGDMKSGKMHGQGLCLTNGFRYLGDFCVGAMQGEALINTPDHEKLVGQVENNLLNGQGMYCTDDFKYIGGFKDGTFHGYGMAQDSDSIFYNVKSVNGELTTLSQANGTPVKSRPMPAKRLQKSRRSHSLLTLIGGTVVFSTSLLKGLIESQSKKKDRW